MFKALWWVFSYRCITYQHRATRTELFWVFFFFELTPEMKTTKMSPVLESFPSSSWNTSVIYNQPLSSCNNTIILQLRLHVLYHIWSHLRETLLRIIGGVPWALDMKMVAFTEVFSLLSPSLFFFANSSSFLPNRHSSDARHLPP